jgi:transcriptional regulator with XRE-family HTH domain
MGRKARQQPLYLAHKLLQIRTALDLSQDRIIERMGLKESLTRNRISEYELGYEPPLSVLLLYARLANVIVDVLIDDDLELPPQIPSPERHEGIPRKKNKSARTPKS